MARARLRGIKQRHPLGSVPSRSGVSLLTAESGVVTSLGVKISALPAAVAATDTDQFETNQGGVSRRLTVAQLLEAAVPEAPIDGLQYARQDEAWSVVEGGSAELPITGGDPVDTGLSRISAGVVGVGNGTAGNASGTMLAEAFTSVGGEFRAYGSSKLTAISDGVWRVTNAALTAGVALDTTTDNQLKVRNRANSADAALTAGTATLTGALTGTSAVFVGDGGRAVVIAASGHMTLPADRLLFWQGLGGIGNLSDAAFILRNNANSASTVLDVNTDATLKVRNSTNSADADLSAKIGQFSVAVTTPAYEVGTTGQVYWVSRSVLRSPSNGVVTVTNNTATAGVALDAATDATLKVRNRANSADAALTAGTATFSGTVFAPGAQIQMVSTQTGAVATGTTIVPVDNTIPQIGEGNEYMSLSITPKSATSKLVIEATWNGSHSLASAILVMALYQDAAANALAVSVATMGAATSPTTIPLTHTMTSGTTSATTFRVRVGGNAAGTTTFNGMAGGGQFGGVMTSSIVIREVAV